MEQLKVKFLRKWQNYNEEEVAVFPMTLGNKLIEIGVAKKVSIVDLDSPKERRKINRQLSSESKTDYVTKA